MCVRLKEMWAKVGLGHSYAFPACAVLEAEALSRARFLKYTDTVTSVTWTLLESQGLFLQFHELLTALIYISQTMQQKQNHYSLIYFMFNQT